MATKPSTTPRGRDAGTGQFTTIPYAKAHPKTTVVERVPLPKAPAKKSK